LQGKEYPKWDIKKEENYFKATYQGAACEDVYEIIGWNKALKTADVIKLKDGKEDPQLKNKPVHNDMVALTVARLVPNAPEEFCQEVRELFRFGQEAKAYFMPILAAGKKSSQDFAGKDISRS
jgi:hypothetical protein